MKFWEILLEILMLMLGFLAVTSLKVQYSSTLIGILELSVGVFILVKK